MNPFYLLIAQYGFEGVMEIIKAVENRNTPSLADLDALKQKYGTKTGAQYLEEAKASLAASALSNPPTLPV